ncbi:MAG: hypothetical protein JSR31_06195 [Nitrospira sp.]|nr:hypothetical protein [Nitrospira sp.]
MPYRVKIDQAVVECDTASEAMELLNITRLSIAHPPLSVISEEPVSMRTHAMSSRREPRVSNRVTEFLFALKDAYPSPLTSEEIAERLGTTPKGIPAVVVGIRVLFKRWGVEFEDMIEWSKRIDNENIVRQYRLTNTGLNILEDQYRTSQQEDSVEESNGLAN